MLRNYLLNLVEKAVQKNNQNILSFITPNKDALMIDLGCDDGIRTMNVADRLESKQIHGAEIVESRSKLATEKGIKIFDFDLNNKFPLENNSYDFVHANQVIEHLTNTDNFISEIKRILKPDGYAVISTESLSSWHNIFALILGFQPFSMTNFSEKGAIGNPFALWKGEPTSDEVLTSWQHNRLFSFKALKDVFEKHGFQVNGIKTTGYYPLPGFFSNIDPIHGHWITIKITKQ